VAARNNHRGIQCREAQKFHRDFKKWCMNGWFSPTIMG
jgi:hypothetical protein